MTYEEINEIVSNNYVNVNTEYLKEQLKICEEEIKKLEANRQNKEASIIDKLKFAQADMDAHSYNEYKDDDEYPIYFTVAEIRYLIDKLS